MLVDTFLSWWVWIGGKVAESQSGWVYLLSTALIAAAGAYFGALGAQRVINRETQARRYREVLMAVNSAHSLTAVIFNQSAALKKQHHLPTLEQWKQQRERVTAAQKDKKSVEHVALHFQTPPPIHFPIPALAELIYSKLTLNGRPLAALSEIVQADHALTTLKEAHDTLRHEFEGQSADYVVPRYLALDTPQGRDERYKDLVFGFVDVLDDLMFFSDVLGRDILEYGELVRDSTPRRLRKTLPKLNIRGTVVPGNEYLIPDHAHHKRWYDNHRMVREPKRMWRSHLWPFGK